MVKNNIAGWALAGLVLVGMPVGVNVLTPPMVLAQMNPVLRGQKYLLWAVYLTQDGDYAEAAKFYRSGFETWERSDVIRRLDEQHKASIPVFKAFAEVNQRLLSASQQSKSTTLQREQQALDKLWRTHKSLIVQMEASLEKQRGIPLFAGTLGVPQLKRSPVAQPTPVVPPQRQRPVPQPSRREEPVANQITPIEPLFQRAIQLTEQGKYAQAQPLYQQALSLLNRELAKLSPQQQQAARRDIQRFVAVARLNEGLLYASQGRHGEAQKRLQGNLELLEEALGRNDSTVVQMRQAIESYRQQAKNQPLTPQVPRQAPTASPTVAQSAELQEAERLHQQVIELYERGRYAEAIPLAQRSLAIREQALGKDHPDVATSLNNLAALYESQGNYGAALPLYQRSLAIREQALGKDHPDVATSLNNLANLYQLQGNYGAALPLYQRSLAIYEKALGKDHPLVAT
ncbi:MAG: tetratricopeptide repeat protein, partial [Gloeomargarita sp. DG02_3_bins_56]